MSRSDPLDTSCILWTKSVGSHGYGQTWDGETVVLAHRYEWEKLHGPIPDGMTIDHICRVRRCINVEHLRLLSNVDNAKDNGQSKKTHCAAGHAFTASNTFYSKEGWRRCRECSRIAAREYYYRTK